MVKRIPFATFYVAQKPMELTLLVSNNGITVDIEYPDSVFGFKTASILMDHLVINSRSGFTDEEMANIIELLRNNRENIQFIAKEGVAYA